MSSYCGQSRLRKTDCINWQEIRVVRKDFHFVPRDKLMNRFIDVLNEGKGRVAR